MHANSLKAHRRIPKGVLGSLAFIAIIALVLSACGDAGLTRAEVEKIARSEMASAPTQTGPAPGVSSDQVEGIVNDAIAEIPQPEPGLSRAEVEEIVRAEMAAQADAESSPGMVPADVEGIVNDAIEKMPQPGPSRAEVEEIVRAEMASAPIQTDPAPGVSSDQVEGIVNDAIAEIPQPGLSRAEVEEIVRAAIASIPPRSAPAEYTRFFVENAIARYETQGLDATLAHYNSPQSVDGQWYVFVIDENDLVIGHPDPERLGLDLNGWVGTDANGYEFGPEMLSATEEGKWVSYVYRNPDGGDIGSGDFELKNAWVARHDGLLFGSGWYIDADEFTRMLVAVAVDRFRELGLGGTMAYFASPGSALAGLEEAIAYYNDAETVDGHWFAFIGDPDGKIVGHSDLSKIGRDTQELFGEETFDVTAEGNWVESESLRVFVAGTDGYVFGSGWSRD